MVNFVNLSGYSVPKAIEDKRKEWVAYGEDNDYYSFLINCFLQSATNNAAINSISNYIYGGGLSIDGMDIESSEVKELRKMINHRCLKKVILERKMLGQAAMQVIYNKAGNNRKVVKIKHFPIHTLRPEKCNDEGVIEAYYYHPDWANKKPNDSLKRIPTFGNSTEEIELFVIKPYISGFTYFSPVDYSGALPYAEMEDEIADYLLNEVKNSFSGTKVINFNNGVPDAEQRDLITRDVKAKLTGSKGQKLIVAFNDNADNKTTVEDITLNDAPSHYEYLADEARNKILVGHRITSPLLLGIKDGGKGFGNNADELESSAQLFQSTVIDLYQDEILEALEEILEVNGEVPELMIITAQPIEFTDESQEGDEMQDEEAKDVKEAEKEEDKETNLSANFKTEEQIDYLTYLSKKGEEVDGDEWELVASIVDEKEGEDEDWETLLNQEVALAAHALGVNDAYPAKDSVQDTKWIKVRYAYVEGSKAYGKAGAGSKRGFCRAMERAKRVYRKEDILQMEKDGLNKELGHNQQPYSIWKHKGGVNCTHVWERRIYVKRKKADGTAWGGGAMNGVKKFTVGQAKKAYGFDPKRTKWKNDKRVAEAQIDRADKGHHPNYFNK